MNCKELVYLLGDYFDGSMEPHLREELDSHIQLCEVCTRFLKTYDTTRILCRTLRPEEIPLEFRDRLKSFVLEKVKEHRSEIDRYLECAAKERLDLAKRMIDSAGAGTLSSAMASLLERHTARCGVCAPYVRGEAAAEALPDEVVAHLSGLEDELPAGEPLFRN